MLIPLWSKNSNELKWRNLQLSPRTVPLPDVLVRMLKRIGPGEGAVFDATNLRKHGAKLVLRPAWEL